MTTTRMRNTATAALAILAVLLVPTAARAAPTAATDLQLPALPGPYQVGTHTLGLVDHGRTDPFAPDQRDREVVVQAWYPGREANAYPPAPYMTPVLAGYEEQTAGLAPGSLSGVRTHAHLDTPVLRADGGWPVALFSPGSGTSRSLYTALVEDLASRGFVVLAMDHPYDADAVELPDGELVLRNQPAESDESNTAAVAVRTADTRFLLDQLPTVDRALSGTLDLHRIGIFGHSMGGATAAAAMLADRRVTAGADLDGSLYGPVVTAGLDRPFLLMSSQLHDRGNDPTWAALWSHLTGRRRDLKLVGSGHLTYSDIAVLASPLHLADHFPPDYRQALFGNIDGTRAVDIEQAYLTAYFEHTLRHRPAPLLSRPDPRYPEILFEG